MSKCQCLKDDCKYGKIDIRCKTCTHNLDLGNIIKRDYYRPNPPNRTRYDRIMAEMTLEKFIELIDIIREKGRCHFCELKDSDGTFCYFDGQERCHMAIRDYLNGGDE